MEKCHESSSVLQIFETCSDKSNLDLRNIKVVQMLYGIVIYRLRKLAVDLSEKKKIENRLYFNRKSNI